MRVPLKDDEYRLFSEWLVQEVGLWFGPERREILRGRLEPLRAELDLPSFERLLFHARYHPSRADVRSRLLSSLTNNESYFFRETRHLELLRDEVLPEVRAAARSEGRPIRILSVGCAAGEEVYTLAIAVRQTFPGLVDVRIIGVDVDTAALERAQEGFYRKHALRGVGDAERAAYFQEEGDGWRIRPEYRTGVEFRYGNVVAGDWPGELDRQDVVFCRNLLIYFDDGGVRRAAENLYQVVRPGGYLFLGHAESLSRVPSRFVTRRRPGVVYYERPEV